jgi:hypothetical protein
MICRDIFRSGKKVGKLYQSKKGISIKAVSEKEQALLEAQLIKPLNRLITDNVRTTDFPLSISDKETITMKNTQWINEIEHHLPADVELGEIGG